MDLRKLKTLIDLVEASDISELELTEGEEKVKLVAKIIQGPLYHLLIMFNNRSNQQ